MCQGIDIESNERKLMKAFFRRDSGFVQQGGKSLGRQEARLLLALVLASGGDGGRLNNTF